MRNTVFLSRNLLESMRAIQEPKVVCGCQGDEWYNARARGVILGDNTNIMNIAGEDTYYFL